MMSILCILLLCVSIHAPARGATQVLGKGYAVKHVSIHAPARGATSGSITSRSKSVVSIHAPARGATPNHPLILKHIGFQSTRPRGARLEHLPDWKEVLTFQSTRPRGARRDGMGDLHKIMEFQSTRPRGARHLGLEPGRRDAAVSIHAPARGATRIPVLLVEPLRVSIHAPARGATPHPRRPPTAPSFQSTRPRGARRYR